MKSFGHIRGFTIPELLVTMTLIAILSTIAFLSYTNYTSQSRDSARSADIKNITQVLNLHKIHSATFPKPTQGINITYSGATVWTQGIFGDETMQEIGKIFGNLEDPKYGNQYTYSVTENKKEYQLGAVFENQGSVPNSLSYNNALGLQSAYAASPFTPDELNPQIWLDAADIDGDGNTANNPANNTTVSTWANKSSAGAANNPSIFNGTVKYATAGFNSNTPSVFIPQNSGLKLNNSDITQGDIFYVVQKRDPFGSTDNNGLGLQSTLRQNYLIGYNGTRRYALRISNSPNHSTTSPATTSGNTNPFIYSFSTDGSNYEFRDTGNMISQGVTNSITGHEWGFNTYGAVNNQGADLVIGEVLIFNQQLSETDRQKVEGYLAHKWEMVSLLPASHPYKTTPPESSGPPIPPDTTPDVFVLTDVTDAQTSTLYSSNSITVSGINTLSPVSISGGEYSVNGGVFTNFPGDVGEGDTVQVRLTSSAANSTTTTATLTIGGVSENYTVTTLVADTTPDTFTFSSISNASLSTDYTSNIINVTGLNVTVPITISGTGALYKISDGIPADATGAGIASASSSQDASNTPDKAFDNDTYNYGWGNNNQLPAILSYDFGAGVPEQITKYTLYRSSNQVGGWTNDNYSPKNWTFEASNNGTSWTVLDTQTNQTISKNAPKQEFSISNTSYYRYYRINISAVNHNSQQWVNITEMEMIHDGGGNFTSNPGIVQNGDIVSIKMPSANTPGSTKIATLNIGDGQGTFSVTTVPADTTPDAFSFIAVTNATLNTQYSSNSITISGINTTTAISISGVGQYKINAGSYGTGASTVQNGDVIQIRQNSSASNSQTTSSTVTIGGVNATYNVTTPAPPPDTTPDVFTFVDITGASVSTTYTSETITVSGINTASSISISGTSAKYDKNGSKNYVSTSGTVQNGDVITVQISSSATAGASVNAVLTIGGISDTFTVTTTPPDTTPDPFTISAVNDAELNKQYISNPFTISGINVGSPISISGGGGKYRVNGGSWVSGAGTVYNGDIIELKLQSLASGNSNVSTTITIGGVSAIYDVTSLNPDTSVDPFVFQTITDANLNTPYISDIITISGINTSVPISVSGGEYRISSTGSFTSASGIVNLGDTIALRGNSSVSPGVIETVSVTVSGYTTTFKIQTKALSGKAVGQQVPKSNIYVTGNYNGLFVHAKAGDIHYVVASPSIIAYDTSDTDVLHIIADKKLVYNGFLNIPSSYSGTNMTMSGGFDFSITAPLLYEGLREDLGSYGGLKQVDEGIKATYTTFPAYKNIASYMDDYSLSYLENILGNVIGINPIKPFYCSDILRSKLIYNIAPLAFITASPSLNSNGTGGIANGKKDTSPGLDDEYHSVDGNASIFFEWPTPQKIGYVKIYNTTNCCSEKLSGGNIKFYNETGEVIYSHSLWNTTGDYVIDLDLEGIGQSHYAKKMSLESVGGNQLNLREVEIYLGGQVLDGIYKVDKDGLGGQSPYNVYCDMTTDGGGWTRIGEDYIHNGNFENQNHVTEHTFQGYNDPNDNLIVSHSIMAPPSSIPDAYVLQKNGTASEPYQLFFPNIPGEYFAQEIRLSAWVKGTTSSIFQNTVNYASTGSSTQPEYTVIATDNGWKYEMVRIPLTGLVKDFTWDVGKNIAGPFYFTGLKMEVYYR